MTHIKFIISLESTASQKFIVLFFFSCNDLCEDGGGDRRRRSVNDPGEHHVYEGPLIRSPDFLNSTFGWYFLL